MIRLRTLTEAECYARLYGSSEPTVTISRAEPRRPRFETTVSGEDLRRGLEAVATGDASGGTYFLACRTGEEAP